MARRARSNAGPRLRWPFPVPGSKRIYGGRRKGRSGPYSGWGKPPGARRTVREGAIKEQL